MPSTPMRRDSFTSTNFNVKDADCVNEYVQCMPSPPNKVITMNGISPKPDLGAWFMPTWDQEKKIQENWSPWYEKKPKSKQNYQKQNGSSTTDLLESVAPPSLPYRV